MTAQDRALATAMFGLHREIRLLHGTIARRFEVTTQQVELLCALPGREPSFGELAGLLGCDKTNVTGMVDRLARKGYLSREPCPADRRVIRVVLTDEGKALGERIREAVTKELAARLPRTGRRELTATLQAVVTALHESR